MINSILYNTIYKVGFNYIQSFIPYYIHPNFITFLSFIFVNLIGFYFNNNLILAILWSLYWTCDNLDGIHARNTKQTSKLGSILDHIVDAYAHLILLNLFYKYNTFNLSIILIYISSICFISSHLLYRENSEMYIGSNIIGTDDLNVIGIILTMLNINITTIINNNLLGIIIFILALSVIIKNMKQINNIIFFIFIILFYSVLFFMLFNNYLLLLCLINMLLSLFLLSSNN